jgi:hypothetical protein
MPTWGRHNWPRKNEGYRLYRERDGSHVLVVPDAVQRGTGHLDAIGNAFAGPTPTLASTSVSREWLLDAGVKRVQWSELTEEWQAAFRRWLDDEKPEDIRGFWLVGQQPKQEAKP